MAGRQNRQLAEDQRNLSSMGYLERDGLSHGVPMDDIPCGANYPLWKPPSNYFPRGEAPPPYEEAVAAARAEQALLSMNPQALPQLGFPNSYLTSANSRTSISLVGNTQSIMNSSPSALICDSSIADSTSLISTPSRPISNPNIYASYRQSNQNERLSPGVSVGTSTTSFTMGTSTYENLPTPIGIPTFASQHSDVPAQSVSSGLQSAIPKNYQTHTTLPRQTGAFTISATLSNSNVTAHRTIPRTLTTRAGTRLRDIINDCSENELLRASSTDVASTNLAHSMQQHSSITKNQENSKEKSNSGTVYEDVQIQLSSVSSSLRGLQQNERQTLARKSEKSHDFKVYLIISITIESLFFQTLIHWVRIFL